MSRNFLQHLQKSTSRGIRLIQIEKIAFENKKLRYKYLEENLISLISNEVDLIANAANMSALIYQALPNVNWAGFYFLKGNELVLGPFQGKPACVRIPIGKGVCGTAVQERKTLLVKNVDEFPGHITCDSASKSEIVVPIIPTNNEVIGVLDIDSDRVANFDEEDVEGLEKLIQCFMHNMR